RRPLAPVTVGLPADLAERLELRDSPSLEPFRQSLPTAIDHRLSVARLRLRRLRSHSTTATPGSARTSTNGAAAPMPVATAASMVVNAPQPPASPARQPVSSPCWPAGTSSRVIVTVIEAIATRLVSA